MVVVVPVRLDALVLAEDKEVTEPPYDFRRLPYVDPGDGRDRRSDTPYLSEALASTPFEDQDFLLRAGVHLHWALPDALTRLVQRESGHGQRKIVTTEAPEVPNRWLLTRSVGARVEAQWVVESDVITQVAGKVAYPVHGDRPYVLLGDSIPLGQWPRAGGEHLAGLTAVGYGDPAFAAFYPSCHSVFGLHDGDRTAPAPGLRYDVLGWYADRSRDPIVRAGDAWQDKLEEYQWATLDERRRSIAGPDRPPRRTVYYGRLTFETEATETAGTAANGDRTGVWVGNTATEALAAHLADALDDNDKEGLQTLLEAAGFVEEIAAGQVDHGIRLAESRHAASFRTLPSGVIWTLQREDAPGEVTAEQKQKRERLRISPEAARGLSVLNQAQARYEAARREIDGLRDQLFADWHKYMLCAYPGGEDFPDPVAVSAYLRRQVETINTGVYFTQDIDAPGVPGRSLAGEVFTAWNALHPALEALNVAAGAARSTYVLREIAGPQFYRPNEPVLLLSGPAATPTERHGQDGRLRCTRLSEDAPEPVTATNLTALRDLVIQHAGELASEGPAFGTWKRDPWHPIMMQWEVEYFPTDLLNNLGPDRDDYSKQFVKKNYTLPSDQVDMSPKEGRDALEAEPNVYRGSSLLSAAAPPVLTARIERYLERLLGTPLKAAIDAYDGKDPQIKRLIKVYRHLLEETATLSNSLGGFNEALLMRRLVYQLPVADPLGFPTYQKLAEAVREAVGDRTWHAPQPFSRFNPIRAGAMRISRLRIVDTFGRIRDVDPEGAGAGTSLRRRRDSGLLTLPPRLAQPARLSLRWLDSRGDVSTNAESASPVCGWLVPNLVDGELAVFAANGSALGRLSMPALGSAERPRWHAAAGAGSVNPYLQEVLDTLEGRPEFLAMVDKIRSSIEPDGRGGARIPTLLLARPLAVVRAALDLELMGRPAVHQGWTQFMSRPAGETDGLERVLFPIRIGERARLDDGVVGYWMDDARTGDFIPHFHQVAKREHQIFQAIRMPPQNLTLLLDPRGAVHVTSGILPVKTIRLPTEHYEEAIGRLELEIFTAPVLTGGAKLSLPLPDGQGERWEWREPDRPPIPVDTTAWNAPFVQQPTLREGRLTLRPGNDQGTA